MGAICRTKSVYVVASTNNIPTSYSTAAGSKCLTGIAGIGLNSMVVYNQTAQDISLVNTDDGSGTPSSSSTEKIPVLANGYIVLDNLGLFNNIFIQSEGTSSAAATSITSGRVIISCFARDRY